MNGDFFGLSVSKNPFAAVGHGKLTLAFIQRPATIRWFPLIFAFQTLSKTRNIWFCMETFRGLPNAYKSRY